MKKQRVSQFLKYSSLQKWQCLATSCTTFATPSLNAKMLDFCRGGGDVSGRLRRYAAKTTQNSEWLKQQVFWQTQRRRGALPRGSPVFDTQFT
jgi:hypothetical protein